MGEIIQHQGLKEEWKKKDLAFQMANIGSEVSRALKNQDKPKRFLGAFERALELFDWTIESVVERYVTKGTSEGEIREICRAREEFCDYFNGNVYHTEAEKMQKYYDEFAGLERGR